MRICVIFNPTARGEKARRFRKHLDAFGSQCALKLTAAAGDARRLAAAAVAEDFEVVVAAGGDGTVNEVLNGIGDAPDGFKRCSLGVLPLGTVNVFAREMAIPANLTRAWQCLLAGKETCIDLPRAEYQTSEGLQQRYFAQLAGAGLDARAVELVQWSLKKKIGVLAYVIAGLKALAGPPADITVQCGTRQTKAQLVLIGNGILYGGNYRLFPEADLRDGLLEVCAFPRVNWLTLARCGPQLLLRGNLPASTIQLFRGTTVTLTSSDRTPMQLDGELAGQLPSTFSIGPRRLRVVVP